MAALARAALGRYTAALQRRPLLVKTGTGTLTAAAGDLLAQRGERRQGGGDGRVDWRRFAAFTAFGAAWTGPVNHLWLPVVNRLGGMGWKLAAQHGFLNPCVYVPGFLGWSALVQGRDAEGVRAYVRERFLRTYGVVASFWLPVTGLIFAKVPEPLQSVTMAGISLGWNIIMSFLTFGDALPLDHAPAHAALAVHADGAAPCAVPA